MYFQKCLGCTLSVSYSVNGETLYAVSQPHEIFYDYFAEICFITVSYDVINTLNKTTVTVWDLPIQSIMTPWKAFILKIYLNTGFRLLSGLACFPAAFIFNRFHYHLLWKSENCMIDSWNVLKSNWHVWPWPGHATLSLVNFIFKLVF